jgi:hypothetical protein
MEANIWIVTSSLIKASEAYSPGLVVTGPLMVVLLIIGLNMAVRCRASLGWKVGLSVALSLLVGAVAWVVGYESSNGKWVWTIDRAWPELMAALDDVESVVILRLDDQEYDFIKVKDKGFQAIPKLKESQHIKDRLVTCRWEELELQSEMRFYSIVTTPSGYIVDLETEVKERPDQLPLDLLMAVNGGRVEFSHLIDKKLQERADKLDPDVVDKTALGLGKLGMEKLLLKGDSLLPPDFPYVVEWVQVTNAHYDPEFKGRQDER